MHALDDPPKKVHMDAQAQDEGDNGSVVVAFLCRTRTRPNEVEHHHMSNLC